MVVMGETKAYVGPATILMAKEKVGTYWDTRVGPCLACHGSVLFIGLERLKFSHLQKYIPLPVPGRRRKAKLDRNVGRNYWRGLPETIIRGGSRNLYVALVHETVFETLMCLRLGFLRYHNLKFSSSRTDGSAYDKCFSKYDFFFCMYFDWLITGCL